MNTQIFIVSCAKHFAWLRYCMESIRVFARDFDYVNIVIPDGDVGAYLALGVTRGAVPIRIKHYRDWPAGKGFLAHMNMILNADRACPEADFIVHVDSDCLFGETVTPQDYIEDGKPRLLFESFASLGKKHPESMPWQACVQKVVSFPVLYETMRAHPEVYHRDLYPKTRREIEATTGQQLDQYLMAQRNEFPQTFCEFNTLGNVAMHYFRDQYRCVDLEREPWPEQKLIQFWSHASPDAPQQPWWKGRQITATPAEFLKSR